MTALALISFVREDFAPVWERVAATVRRGYYARSTRREEMERLLAKAAPKVKAAGSRAAFRDAVNAMIAEFGDSHFELFTDEDQGYYLMDGLVQGARAEAMPQVGAWFRRAPDGYTVTMVLEGGAAERAGLRVGDLVTRADGLPFSPIAALRGDVGRTATLAYRRDGREGEAEVAVTQGTALRMFLDATLASRRTIEAGGRRYGYLHLWTQVDDDFAKALRDAVAAAQGADGFVLDLRAGFGGHPNGFDAPFKRSAYEGPLAVVIDHGSRSAKEVLSYELQRAGRATLVGERTAGDVLGASPVRLNDWAYLEIPATDVRIAGVRLEKVGVTPDVPVPTGEDPVARAVAYLGTRRTRV